MEIRNLVVVLGNGSDEFFDVEKIEKEFNVNVEIVMRGFNDDVINVYGEKEDLKRMFKERFGIEKYSDLENFEICDDVYKLYSKIME